MLRARRTEARSTHPQGVYCKANCKPRCEASDAKHPNTGPRHLSTLESAQICPVRIGTSGCARTDTMYPLGSRIPADTRLPPVSTINAPSTKKKSSFRDTVCSAVERCSDKQDAQCGDSADASSSSSSPSPLPALCRQQQAPYDIETRTHQRAVCLLVSHTHTRAVLHGHRLRAVRQGPQTSRGCCGSAPESAAVGQRPPIVPQASAFGGFFDAPLLSV
jgi:hypothetical protein